MTNKQQAPQRSLVQQPCLYNMTKHIFPASHDSYGGLDARITSALQTLPQAAKVVVVQQNQ